MHPILFHYHLPDFFGKGEMIVFSYDFFNILGIILAFIYPSVVVLKKFKTTFYQKLILINATFIAGYLGSHIFKILSTPKQNYDAIVNHTLPSMSGGILYGVLFFLLPTMFFLAKRFKIPEWEFLDVIAIAFPIYMVFLRIGCFSAGCCYGIPTHSVFGIQFTDTFGAARPLGQPIHPTQLYSLFNALVILIVLIIVKRNRKFNGQLILLFLILYGIGRSIIEIFRVHPEPYIIQNVLTQAQFTSIIVIIVALLFYRKLREKASVLNAKS